MSGNGTGTSSDDPFARCMGEVAIELLGEPSRRLKGGAEWRWGTHDSFRVVPELGVFEDHEAGVKGGVLRLLEHKRGLDDMAAKDWLRQRGHLPDNAPTKPVKPRIVATYPYHDAAGEMVFEVVRFDPKTFRQRRPDAHGGRIWDMRGVELVPYRLPALLDAVRAGRRVFVVEGEKSADRLAALGLDATCSPQGAGKWRDAYSPHLDGAEVCILPDNDDPGRAHADQVARSLRGHAVRIRVLELSGLPIKGDVVDWLDAGGTAESLRELARNAPLLPAEPMAQADAGTAPDAGAEAAPQPHPVRGREFGRLRVLSVADALDALPRTYILDGLLAERELSVWWGPPKSGKSFLMLRIAYGIPLGRGMWGREAEPMPVLYVAAEGESGVNGRIRALHGTMGDAPGFHFIAQSADLFSPDADLSSLIAAATFYRARMVVVDTLARVMGAGDENKTPDMNAFIVNMDRIREAIRAHVAVVHHGGWEGAHARGSIALIGAADLVIKVEGSRETPHSALVEYNKDGPDGDLMGFKLDVFDLPLDAKGRPRTTCIAVETDAPANPATPAGKRPTKMDEESATLLRDLHAAFASGVGKMAIPLPDMPPVPTFQRSVLKEQLLQSGWLRLSTGLSNNEPILESIGQGEDVRLWKRLNHLKLHGKIGFNRDVLWLASEAMAD